MPDDLTGRPRTVIKDPAGGIMYVEWEDDGEPQLRQRFVCEECGKAFVAGAEVAYSAAPAPEEEDFSVEEASLL
jgi:hypothetical protein